MIGNLPQGRDPTVAASEPATVETARGLSVTYRGRHLYSRYDPEKNPVEAARNACIQDETLVLCVSPLLGYGLDIILQKTPPSSFVLCLECDENLMDFSAKRIPQENFQYSSFAYIRTSSIARLLETVSNLKTGAFRRCLRIDLSGGASLYPDFYRSALAAIDEYISRWWKNHVTLMKLGRNYARNFFTNCEALPSSSRIRSGSVNRPIMVAGAGPSLDASLDLIARRRDALFLLAVDTALPSLRDRGIVPDAVILIESQFWITRAFIGFRDSLIPVYADLTASPQAVRSTGGPVHFFHTVYARASFLSRFADEGFPLPEIPPLGSVGLSALALARMLAADGTPVLFTGLDFSWGRGFTHSRGAPSVRNILAGSGRYSTSETETVPSTPAIAVMRGKDGSPVRTDPALSGYAALCAAEFGESPSPGERDPSRTAIFDIGESGLPTGCEKMTNETADELLRTFNSSGADITGESALYGAEGIADYLSAERKRLSDIRDILTGHRDAGEETTAELMKLLNEADYLYLHFPDGYRGASPNTAFLKRVRIELEYFLKTLDHPRNP